MELSIVDTCQLDFACAYLLLVSTFGSRRVERGAADRGGTRAEPRFLSRPVTRSRCRSDGTPTRALGGSLSPRAARRSLLVGTVALRRHAPVVLLYSKRTGQRNKLNDTHETGLGVSLGVSLGSASGWPRGYSTCSYGNTYNQNKQTLPKQPTPTTTQTTIHWHAAHNNNPPHASNTQSHAPKSAAATRPTEGRARGCSVPNYWVSSLHFFATHSFTG